MEQQMVYAVVITTTENGGRGYSRVVGVFSSRYNAANALEEIFNKKCDSYGVTELNDYSYYTAGDSFNIEGDDSEFSVYGEITGAYLDNTINNDD